MSPSTANGPDAPSAAVPAFAPTTVDDAQDWSAFIAAYALGSWDPQRTPKQPQSLLVVESSADLLHPRSVPPAKSLQKPRLCSVAPAMISLPSLHNYTFSTASIPSSDPASPSTEVAASNADIRTAAATLRWAASSVKIAPLALPSPEYELTDPLRGVTAAIPGSYSSPHESHSPFSHLATGARQQSLDSFWVGTTDVEKDSKPHIASFPVSADDSRLEAELRHKVPPYFPVESLYESPTGIVPVAVSQEPQRMVSSTSRDYFSPTLSPTLIGEKEPTDSEPVIPALRRKVCLARQTSSPLPVPPPRESVYFNSRNSMDSIAVTSVARASKEDQMFTELGFLAPPHPPEELERRRALYRFNILHTGPDANFDRITHLSKLVFSTNSATISLIDGHEQWFKSEFGLKSPTTLREHSFDAHAILQQDEPLVILDTHRDWRFTKHPLVIGRPYIRFYAGAPLRTQDGFNLGTLAIIDDTPRQDFSPRHRHTLKEFAAIAVREMELWKDKIQLRIRDRIQISMEEFSRECLEIDAEAHSHKDSSQQLGQQDQVDFVVDPSMDRVYDRAAKLVKRTLDVEGVIVMDVSHCEVLETKSMEGTVSVILHYGDIHIPSKERELSGDEYRELNIFFGKYPDGKISEGILPLCLRPFLPAHIHYTLTVPIFNINKRPFALLCAYNISDHTKLYLEGHELSYLRAIGVIILSAVLKRQMILADKAKIDYLPPSFSISHELRTPLHGILAAVEMLGETPPLTHPQLSFLQTIEACGRSLVETVNHVLDFTKLSGNSKAGGVENVVMPTIVDLVQLVEEAVDGCWIGHQARTGITGNHEIGSMYSPPKDEWPTVTAFVPIETVIDIGYRAEGWTLKCQKGGIRRILINIFGNSLKFTQQGFIHVILRESPLCEGDPMNKVKIELIVHDTGKGMSQNFLKNQLFHPFSQENPLQTGTGLGLAIVNSIVTSDTVGGKVDVWSEEGAGTEIKVTFFAEKADEDEVGSEVMNLLNIGHLKIPTISLVGFDAHHEGMKLLRRTIQMYISWWGFKIHPGPAYGDIAIINDDPSVISEATSRHEIHTPFILLSATRGNPRAMAIAGDHEHIGGFCRVLFKPGGPSRLRAVLQLATRVLQVWNHSRFQGPSIDHCGEGLPNGFVPRRNSDESYHLKQKAHPRRLQTLRSFTVDALPARKDFSQDPKSGEANILDVISDTVTVAYETQDLLPQKSELEFAEQTARRIRVLIMEDNLILRNILIKWLSQKGYNFRDAVDGQEGVSIFERDGPFDVVLLDLSMPVLDGIAATAEIRRIESRRVSLDGSTDHRPGRTRILALTGMSSLEDKRRAFEAGVDDYLVKPVAFKALDDVLYTLGLS